MKNELMTNEFGIVMSGDFLPVFNATAFARVDVLKALLELQMREDLSKVLNLMALSKDMKGLNMAELAEQAYQNKKQGL